MAQEIHLTVDTLSTNNLSVQTFHIGENTVGDIIDQKLSSYNLSTTFEYDIESNKLVLSIHNQLHEVDVSKFVVDKAHEAGLDKDTKRSSLKFYKELGKTNASLKAMTDEVRESIIGMPEFAKFGTGLFIHWGVYAVPAGNYTGPKQEGCTITATSTSYNTEWIMRDLGIPKDTYKAFEKDFNTTNWNAFDLVKAARDAGMGYVVITIKHHEGFSLYPSNYSNWDVRTAGKEGAPCRTTIIDELKNACDTYGLKFGIYYSQYWDWMAEGGFGLNHNAKWNGSSADLYTDKQHKAYCELAVKQLKEIADKYDPFIIWWDPGTSYSSTYTQYFKDVLDSYLNIYINNDRALYDRSYGGDYGTGERTICLRNTKYGEACFTMNNTWGYSDNNETKYYSTETIFKQYMLYSLAYGQNCLMNIGPKGDGTIPSKQLEFLSYMKEFGQKYGYFKNYSRVSNTTIPSWGFTLGFPDNVIMCYVVAKGNTGYQNTVLDGINCTNLESVEILTPGTDASYELIPSENKIVINGLALDPTSKVGVVKLTYTMLPLHPDASSLKCNELLKSRTCPMKSGVKYNFTDLRYEIRPAGNIKLASDFVWFDDTDEYNAELVFTNNSTTITNTITLTITDNDDGAVTTVTYSEDAKKSETPISLIKGHTYTQSIVFSSTDTDYNIIYDGIKFISKTVHVTGITLDETSITLEHDGSSVIEPIITPSNASNKEVTWQSSNEAVVTVYDGLVYAQGKGEATITATTVDRGYTATCSVTVKPSPEEDPTHPTDVVVSPKTLSLKIGDESTLTHVVHPDDATYKSVAWTSDNEAVATVVDGVVTGISEGVANITVTTVDGGKTDTCIVTVSAIHVDSVTVDKTSFESIPGYGTKLTATVLPAEATDKSITWSVDDETIATVDQNGNVSPQSAGTTTVTVSSVDGNKTATCIVTVNAETYDYSFERESLDGTDYEEAKIDGENIKIFSDETPKWTLFSFVQNSLCPNTDKNATLYQVVADSSPWTGLRVDANNNNVPNTGTTPAPMCPRFLAVSDIYFNCETMQSGSADIKETSAYGVKHPLCISRDGETYKYSFDGITWEDISITPSALTRIKNAILTVGFDYKRAGGTMSNIPYRILRTDHPCCVALKYQSEYKFHTMYNKYYTPTT